MKTRSAILLAALAALGASGASLAQDYPTQQIRIVIALPPGGSADTIGRMFGEHLRGNLKQPVVIENRAGGDGLIGPTVVAKSKPDGHTLLFSTPSLPTAKAFLKTPAIDPEKELIAIGQVVESPFVIAVSEKHDVKSVKEFLDKARQTKAPINIGYFAAGNRLSIESFRQLSVAKDIQMTPVGYKGEAPMLAALAGGEVDIGVATAVTVKGLAQQGKVRALAVTGAKRSISMPELPTADESGATGYDPGQIWFGLLAPAGTPQHIVQKLSEQVFSFAKIPGIDKKLEPYGFAPLPTTPEEFAKLIARDAERAVRLGKVAGIEPQ